MTIIEKVKALDLPLGQYVVFGSGPLAAHGIRESHDIDLFITTELYRKLRYHGWTEHEWPEGGHYLTKGDAEADDSWSYGDYNPSPAEVIAVAEIIDGIAFAPLSEVLKWKQAFARPKDKVDIQLINAYLKPHSGTVG